MLATSHDDLLAFRHGFAARTAALRVVNVGLVRRLLLGRIKALAMPFLATDNHLLATADRLGAQRARLCVVDARRVIALLLERIPALTMMLAPSDDNLFPAGDSFATGAAVLRVVNVRLSRWRGSNRSKEKERKRAYLVWRTAKSRSVARIMKGLSLPCVTE